MRIASLIAAAGAATLLAACAEGPGYGYGYGPSVAVVGYDGYYDDYYGPFYDGYWGSDGALYYRGRDNDRWHRDSGQHFRHDAAAGNRFHPVQGHPHEAPPPRHEHPHE